MVARIDYSNLASDLGTETADGIRNIANAAGNFLCDIYRKSPEYLITQINPFSPVSQYLNGFMSRLCGPRAKAPDPLSAAFSGGQCAVPYNFSTGRLTYQLNGDPDSNGENIRNFTNIMGPLGYFRQYTTKATVLGKDYVAYSPHFICPVNDLDLGGPSYNKPALVRVFNIVRTDGLPDTCGNPPVPNRPTVPPTVPDVVNNNTFVNVGGITIPVAIALIPTYVSANAEFNPVFRVKVGDINVDFDAGGVTLSPNFNFNTNVSIPIGTDPRPTPPTPVDPNKDHSNPSNYTTKADLADVIKELDDIKNCSCPVSYTVSTVNLFSGIAGYSALPSNCIKVNLNIDTTPTNAKTQKGNGSEPTKYFCGYYYWGDGTGRTERIPISVLQSVFFKPDWATAFGYDLYLGYSGSASATYLVPNKSGAQLATVQMKQAPT